MRSHSIFLTMGTLFALTCVPTGIAQTKTLATSQILAKSVPRGRSTAKSLGVSRLGERTSKLTIKTLDAKGHLVKVVEPDERGKPAFTTEITYGVLGKVTLIKQYGDRQDAARLRTFEYDAQGRVVSTTSPEAGPTKFTYDSEGNLSTKTDGRGNTVTYFWDNKKRLTARQYTDGTATHVFSYNSEKLDRLTYLDTPTGHESERDYRYNSKGQLEQLIVHVPGKPEEGYDVRFGYDDLGRVSSMTYPDGRVVSQTWTKSGLLNSSSDGTSDFFSRPSYLTASGRLTEATFGNGLLVQRDFDAHGRVTGLTLKHGDVVVLDEAFEYTGTASLKTVTDKLHAENNSWYDYDQLGRVARARGAKSEEFRYDAFGNRAMRKDGGISAIFDGANRFTTGPGYTYDAAGEMTFDGVHRYTYDGNGMIVGVDDGAIGYSYDAEGNRIQKRLSDGLHDYVWLDGRLLAERAPDGSWTDYVYATGRRIAGVLQKPHKDAKIVPPQVNYYLTSPLGVIRTSLLENGEINHHGSFAPFGELAHGDPAAAAISFSDEVHDPETGLDSYRYRSYNPRLGRWMSPDPSSLHFSRIDNPQTYNLYSYVTNNPLKYTDVGGLCEGGDDDGEGVDVCDIPPPANGGGGGDGGDGGSGDPCAYDACVTTNPDPPVDPEPIDPGNVCISGWCFTSPGDPPDPAPDPGESSAGGVNLANLRTNAKNSLSAKCEEIIASHITGYQFGWLSNAIDKVAIYQFPDSIPARDSGANSGTDAFVHTSTNPPYIDLLPGFYAETASTQPFVLIHESIHALTGGTANDSTIQSWFGLSLIPDTHNITDFLQRGCQ